MRYIPALLILGTTVSAYVVQHGEFAKNALFTSWITTDDAGDAAGDAGQSAGDGAEAESDAAFQDRTPESARIAADEPQHADFSEVLRFDLTPDEINERRSHVSAGLSNVNLQGYRVPLVTGTAASDLAGSLTYSFDAQSRLRRIAFLGKTGDPRRIVEFVTRQFAFRRVKARVPQQLVFAAGLPYRGQLQIATAAATGRGQAANGYRVALTIER